MLLHPSILTSWFCAPVSRTQTYLSLSMVTLVKVMALCCTPRLVSCSSKEEAGGKAVSGGSASRRTWAGGRRVPG